MFMMQCITPSLAGISAVFVDIQVARDGGATVPYLTHFAPNVDFGPFGTHTFIYFTSVILVNTQLLTPSAF